MNLFRTTIPIRTKRDSERIHFQIDPFAQTKLVRCISGSVLDVAVDLRKGSPDFRKWIAVELSGENKRQLLIPRGFGHAYLTLTENVEFLYKVDHYYSPDMIAASHGMILKSASNGLFEDPILSEKDRRAPLLKDSDVNFNSTITDQPEERNSYENYCHGRSRIHRREFYTLHTESIS
jgi:dTDP-4-dehydrorhamnose 3,5-epimerase